MTRALKSRKPPLNALSFWALAVCGCGPTITELESRFLPEPKPPSSIESMPAAYARSQINDPRLHALGGEFQTWVLKQQTQGPSPAPLFTRVEVLPPVLTVLPYGVGAYEQEPRLPVVLTIGPGWKTQEPEEKEAIAARVFGELSRCLEALSLRPALRPTLTIQTQSGLVLSWINDLVKGRRNVHGDEELALATSVPSEPPPSPTAVERGKNSRGSER
jgi:hypothetical protein